MADAVKEPGQINWDNYNPGSKYQAPPQAKGPDGKFTVFYGQLPTTIEQEVDDDGYRRYLLDPIKIVKSGAADGYLVRFGRVSVKPWINHKTGEPKNASAVGNLLRAAGVMAKPQKTTEYDAAVNLLKGKIAPFTLDWEARNKDTGEQVRGYQNFPDDPQYPGTKKAILKQGDTYTDESGAVQTVQSEVLFANARLRFFEGGKK
jgi:hypothetical protein